MLLPLCPIQAWQQSLHVCKCTMLKLAPCCSLNQMRGDPSPPPSMCHVFSLLLLLQKGVFVNSEFCRLWSPISVAPHYHIFRLFASNIRPIHAGSFRYAPSNRRPIRSPNSEFSFFCCNTIYFCVAQYSNFQILLCRDLGSRLTIVTGQCADFHTSINKCNNCIIPSSFPARVFFFFCSTRNAPSDFRV